MKLRVGIALLFAFSAPVAVIGQNPKLREPTPEQTEKTRRAVMKLLSEQMIPRVQMDKATIREAVEFFAQNSGRHFSLILKLGDEPNRHAPPLITIQRQNISAREFLGELCKQGELKWTIELYAIVIVPKPK